MRNSCRSPSASPCTHSSTSTCKMNFDFAFWDLVSCSAAVVELRREIRPHSRRQQIVLHAHLLRHLHRGMLALLGEDFHTSAKCQLPLALESLPSEAARQHVLGILHKSAERCHQATAITQCAVRLMHALRLPPGGLAHRPPSHFHLMKYIKRGFRPTARASRSGPPLALLSCQESPKRANFPSSPRLLAAPTSIAPQPADRLHRHWTANTLHVLLLRARGSISRRLIPKDPERAASKPPCSWTP